MLKESLKYMLLSLLVAGLVFCGVYWGISALGNALFSDTPAQTEGGPSLAASPSPSPTDTPAPTPTPSPTPMTETAEDALRAYIAAMPVEEKLGQMVLFGGRGVNSPGEEYSGILRDYRVGNLILYGNNIESGDGDGGFGRAASFIDALKSTLSTDIPPLVAIDVEGGKVVRFRWDTWPSSAATLGSADDKARAVNQFQAIGAKLFTTGVNTNLAPVLDISDSPMDSFLGTRIFSGDPDVAARMGVAVTEGLHIAGCLSVAKHFPGHGGTAQDSHDVTPVVDKSADELRAYDMVPFAAAIENGVDAILVAHILYPALDNQDIASMSPLIITDILRGELGFAGIVVSDDFRMNGLNSRYDTGDAAARFVLAGGDVIMCGAEYDRQKAIMEGLYAAVSDGRLTEERINESLFRILSAKERYLGWSPAPSAG